MQVKSIETGNMISEEESGKTELDAQRDVSSNNVKISNKAFKKCFNSVWNSTEMNVTHHFLGAILYAAFLVYFMIIEPSLSD